MPGRPPLLWKAHARGQEAGVRNDAAHMWRRASCAAQVAWTPREQEAGVL